MRAPKIAQEYLDKVRIGPPAITDPATRPQPSEPPPPRQHMLQKLERITLRSRYTYTLLETLYKLEKDENIIDTFREIYPNVRDELMQRGLKCLELHLYPQAYQVFAFVIRFEHNAFCHVALADAMVGLKRFRRAIPHYQAAIDEAPHIPDASLKLSEIYLILQQPHKSLALLDTLAQQSWHDRPDIETRISSQQDVATQLIRRKENENKVAPSTIAQP